MLEIMKAKEKVVSEIFSDTEKKLEKIISEEFKDFEVVKVTSRAFHDELELQKDGKKIKFHLASTRYERKDRNEKNKGLYFRRLNGSTLEFDKKEFKEIQERLQALYER